MGRAARGTDRLDMSVPWFDAFAHVCHCMLTRKADARRELADGLVASTCFSDEFGSLRRHVSDVLDFYCSHSVG